MYRQLMYACVALLAISSTAFPQSSDALRGTWAVQVEDRNLFVLRLEGETGKLTGTLTRPMRLTIGQSTPTGTRVSGVETPLFTVQVREVRASPVGRIFALAFQTNDAGEILINGDESKGVRFAYGASASESSMLPLLRVSDTATVSADWNPSENYLIPARVEAPNAEMTAIFVADQSDRAGTVDWSVVRPRDQARLKRVRELLDSGALRAADDYYNAAFVFQHGDTPEDCLLAHALAMASMTLGRNDAAWIATATLDRYLQRIDRSQIFGTQYVGVNDSPMTQGAYDTELIPDSLRRVLGVPIREQQLERLKQINTRP
jgi:hypothetical protein